MRHKIVHPPNNQEEMEGLLEPIFTFIETHMKARFGNPENFVSAWMKGHLRVYVAEDSSGIQGVTFVTIIYDPVVSDLVHAIRSLSLGVNFDHYINDTLSIFGAKI
jgi:hypothetical protein